MALALCVSSIEFSRVFLKVLDGPVALMGYALIRVEVKPHLLLLQLSYKLLKVVR